MNIPFYRQMLADRPRVKAFHRAIHATVRPGDVVVEVGAGLGTYSLFAAQAGARRVYAIETDPEICRLGVCLAEQNGLADRVKFLQGYSTDVELPERADVAIFEDYSSFFFSSGLPDLLMDIRERYLKPSGRLIPRGVDLFLAAGENPRLYRQLDLLRKQRDRVLGLDFSETRRLVMNQPIGTEVSGRHLLTSPRRCARIRLGESRDLGFRFTDRSRVRRNGVVHGLVGWMEFDLAPGVRLSCSPLRPPTVWCQDFHPFAEPLRVRRGQDLRLAMDLMFSGGTSHFVQRWGVIAGAESREGNTFAGAPFSEQSLARGPESMKGRLGPRSRVLLTMLMEMGTEATYGRIASALVKKHPLLFEDEKDALATVVRAIPALSTVAGEL